MKTVEMPKMADTMEEGKILRWLKQEGDTVKKGEPIAEIETDKVTIEIESFSSGVLRKILVPEGSSALVGADIALVGTPDEPLPASNGTATSPAATPVLSSVASMTSNGASIASHASPTSQASQASPARPASTPLPQGRIFISPIARRLAEEHHLDYARIRGTGPNGRIIKMDIEA